MTKEGLSSVMPLRAAVKSTAARNEGQIGQVSDYVFSGYLA